MNNRKSKLFGKKDKFNLFVVICVVSFIVFAVYVISVPTKMEKTQTGSLNENFIKNDVSFEQKLDVNENVIDNAVQVKEQSDQKLGKDTENKNSDSNNEVAINISNDNNFGDSGVNIAETVNEDIAEVSTSSLSFVSPVDGSIIRVYSDDTIYSKTLNTWRTREGVDFKVDIGTPVMSVMDGTVEKIDNDLTERGRYIIIKHDDGFKTVYTNLDEDVKVVNGQKVRKGEIIASVGNSSGNYSSEEYGAHFNFIMYLNNEEVNPSEYIKFK